MNDMEKFVEFYKQFGISLVERNTKNDETSAFVLEADGKQFGFMEIVFDENRMFIEHNFLPD